MQSIPTTARLWGSCWRVPQVLHGILWEWMKTTTPPASEVPVEPYFSGIAGTDYRVSLLWRAHVPDDGAYLWPRATAREVIDIPIGEVRDALGEDEDLRRLDTDGVTIWFSPTDRNRGATTNFPSLTTKKNGRRRSGRS